MNSDWTSAELLCAQMRGINDSDITDKGKRNYQKRDRQHGIINDGMPFKSDLNFKFPDNEMSIKKSHKATEYYVFERDRKITLYEIPHNIAKRKTISLVKMHGIDHMKTHLNDFVHPIKQYIEYIITKKTHDLTLCSYILPPQLTKEQHLQLAVAFHHYSYGNYKYWDIINNYKKCGWMVRFKEKYKNSGKYVGRTGHAYAKYRDLKDSVYKHIHKKRKRVGDGLYVIKKKFVSRSKKNLKKNEKKIKKNCGRKKKL